MILAISTTWWPAPKPARRSPSIRWNGACAWRRRARRGWTITQILNTHEHLDHTGGNAGLVGATHAQRAGACAGRAPRSAASIGASSAGM